MRNDTMNAVAKSVYRAYDELMPIPGLPTNGMTLGEAFHIMQEWQRTMKRVSDFAKFVDAVVNADDGAK